MSFTATIKGLALPDILQTISVGKQSGFLTVISSGAAGRLVFKSGRVVYASSDTQSRLGYTLVETKMIFSEEDLTCALELQRTRNDKMPLASAVVKQGFVFPGILETETKDHIMKIFSDIVGWKEGMIYFEPHDISDSLTLLKEGLSIHSLLLEAALVQDKSTQLDREICEFLPDDAEDGGQSASDISTSPSPGTNDSC